MAGGGVLGQAGRTGGGRVKSTEYLKARSLESEGQESFMVLVCERGVPAHDLSPWIFIFFTQEFCL